MIVIIDYDTGNLNSIRNMIAKIGFGSVISNNPEEISKAQKLILPGIGSVDTGMKKLRGSGLLGIVEEKVKVQKTPVLGICLGMQIMSSKSSEGNEPCLSWIDGEVVRFNNQTDSTLKIPQMTWNTVKMKKESKLFAGIEDARFYFAHSYHLITNNPGVILTTSFYGCEFVSSVEYDNILGVQFHPEKSHKYGMKLFQNFIENY